MTNRIYLSPPDVGLKERDALLRAFDSGWIAPVGPDLEAFEKALSDQTGWNAVALASGTAALHLALLAVGVSPGDDVAVSTFTFAATANAVRYVGANPIFIDSELTSWNMSPDLLAEELAAGAAKGRLPTAVVVVDLYGQCADYTALTSICDQYQIPIVEDAAEALGATHGENPAGTLGSVGVLSFNGNKIITCSGGGALLTHDKAVAERVRYLATQARQPAVHYQHTEVGFNYRLSNLLAALGHAQLSRLGEMSDRRRQINRSYRAALQDADGIDFMPLAPWGNWNGWLTCVTFEDAKERDRVQDALTAADIESRPLWKPLHLQPAFADDRRRVDGTSERLFEHGLCLPSGSGLNDDDVTRVLSVICEAVKTRP